MPQTIEIFRAGTHTDGAGVRRTFSRADIAAMAAGYSQHKELAPVVLGHPAADAPAYGWVQSLRADGDLLVAEIDQVEPSFAQAVRDGRFRHVSAALFLPHEAHNPTPGQWALRHVGFLGAQLPAVTGLKPATFAADAAFVAVRFSMAPIQQSVNASLWRRFREWMIGSAGQEAADRVAPSSDIDLLAMIIPEPEEMSSGPDYSQRPKETPVDPTQEAALAAERQRLQAEKDAVEAERAELVRQRATFAQGQAALRAAEDAAFLDRLQAEGRALPVNRADTLALLAALPAEGADMVAFSQGEPRSPRAALRELLERQPKMVAFGQVAGGEAVALADPDSSHQIRELAQAYISRRAAEGLQTSISEAISAVTQGHAA